MSSGLHNYLSSASSTVQFNIPPFLKRIIIFSILIVLFLLLTGFFIKIDKIIHVRGMLKTGSDVQTIYAPFDMKIIRQIKSQGSLVKQGEIAFEIDEHQYKNSISIIESQLYKLKRRLTILLINIGFDHKSIPTNLTRFVIQNMNVAAITTDEQLELELAEVDRLKALHDVLLASRSMLDRKLSYERERLQMLNKAEEGIYSRSDILKQREVTEDLVLELMTIETQILENKAQVRSANSKIENFDSEIVEPIIVEIYDIYGELLELESKLNYSKQVQYFLLLGAEYESYIEKYHISKGTQSIKEGDPIYDIIRTYAIEDFYVQSILTDSEVSWVNLGDPVKVNLLSGGRDLGYIVGKVEVISNASNVDKDKKGFLMTVVLEDYHNVKMVEPLTILRPGLEVSVNVSVGRRRVLDYFLEPFKNLQKKAFREPSEL